MDRILYKEADGDITCRSRDFDKVFPTLYAYEELEMTPEDIEKTLLAFSSFLCEMTGGRMSKTNYTVQAMVDEANDYRNREIEELEAELAKVKAERNAAVQDLNLVTNCDTCMYRQSTTVDPVDPCEECTGDCYVWRGAKDTNVPGKKEE